MKKNRFTLAAAVAILASSSLLLAGNPKTSGSQDNLADIMIEKMGKDVVLTDSQKMAAKQKLKKYIAKMQDAHALGNNDEKLSRKKQASDEYQLSLDSILTPAQNEQLRQRTKERENAK
ncbi:MAG TPA: hypothetical protein VK152_01925 [Paludibacter sp.]|nr:hypothetical protein [Paludibacter sp.]